jgi:hypothetical protein
MREVINGSKAAVRDWVLTVNTADSGGVPIARSRRASKDARLSTDCGDVAIQKLQGARRPLNRFAYASDDALGRPNRIVLKSREIPPHSERNSIAFGSLEREWLAKLGSSARSWS